MENLFFPARRAYSPRPTRYPTPPPPAQKSRVISIPVHFANDKLGSPEPDRSSAAVKILKILRGFLVRKNMQTVKKIAAEAMDIGHQISAVKIRADAMERLRIGEMLMALLLRLDAVRGVREYRKKVIRQVIQLQEVVDSIALGETPDSDESKAMDDMVIPAEDVDGDNDDMVMDDCPIAAEEIEEVEPLKEVLMVEEASKDGDEEIEEESWGIGESIENSMEEVKVMADNIKSFAAEIRFSLEMTLDSVKEKLWKKCGTSVDSMRLELFDDAGVKICDLSDNLRPLGFYSPQDGYRLHIIDLDLSSLASGGWLEDTSLVEKYKISEEAYDKLDSNFRKFKEKLISQSPASHENSLAQNYMEDLCMNIKVGDRCEVEPGEKRGVVKFLGRAETVAAGIWVGIQLDEPLGKNDGMVKGKRYFDCPPQHGLLVRPDKVKVGDYPERDPFEEDEI